MNSARSPPGTPGGPPQIEKRDQYLRLMAQGMNNSEACRIVGVGRGTGIYWRYGRTVKNPDGSVRRYDPIMAAVQISERFLSEDERVTIADRHQGGCSIRGIAAALGRSPSTSSREIRRNSDPSTGRYHPFRAPKRARARRARPKIGKLPTKPGLLAFVQQCLDIRWNPQQISNVLPGLFPNQPEMRVSHETIYQALYQPEHPLTRACTRRALRSGRLKRRRRRHADSTPPTSSTPAKRSTAAPPRRTTAPSPATGNATWSWANTINPPSAHSSSAAPAM
jgi:IS30 family transposase